jgi:hypothetical protein
MEGLCMPAAAKNQEVEGLGSLENHRKRGTWKVPLRWLAPISLVKPEANSTLAL